MSYNVEDIPAVIEFAKRVRERIENKNNYFICSAAYDLSDGDNRINLYSKFTEIIEFGLTRDPSGKVNHGSLWSFSDWFRRYNELNYFYSMHEELEYLIKFRLMWIDKIISDLEKYQSDYSKK